MNIEKEINFEVNFNQINKILDANTLILDIIFFLLF